MSQNKLLTEHLQSEYFDEQDWMSVLLAVEESYAQSLEYQTQIEEQNITINDAHDFISEVVSSMSDILIVTDDDLIIKQVNASFLAMTSLSEPEVLKKPLGEFIELPESIELRKQSIDLLDKMVKLKGKHQVFDISVNCNCHKSANHKVKGLVLVGRPMGDLLHAYDALKKAHIELAAAKEQMMQTEKMAALGRLVAGIAHEINTPISVVKGNLWSLSQYAKELDENLAGSNNTEICEILQDLPLLLRDTSSATDQITSIVKNLKIFSNPSNQTTRQKIDINKVIQVATNWVTSTNHISTDLIKFNLSNSLFIYGVTEQLQQVLINLIQNAIDVVQSLPNPEIIISTKEKQGNLELTIEDNGSGISVEMLNCLFDPFTTTKDVGHGTGLGLSICYQIINEMGGELAGWNKIEGGAIFQIKLPLGSTV
jgi:two-component system sensor histidine kinase HupT/HoxJ